MQDRNIPRHAKKESSHKRRGGAAAPTARQKQQPGSSKNRSRKSSDLHGPPGNAKRPTQHGPERRRKKELSRSVAAFAPDIEFPVSEEERAAVPVEYRGD